MIDPFTQAYIEPWVTLGEGVTVHPFAYVGKLPSFSPSLARRHILGINNLTIGRGTEIGPHAVIYTEVRIGEFCLIGDGANIREGVTIGDNCIIGTHVSISYNTIIGNNVRIMQNTHITGKMKIGNNTFIGCNVATSNDRKQTVVDYIYNDSEVVGPIIGERCLIGSGVVLLAGITIGNNAIIGSGALVVKDVPEGATVLGYPAAIRP